MVKPNALHHLALSTANMKAQIAYFTDVLGMELVALYWMHGVEGAWHGFLKLSETCSIAFVQTRENTPREPTIGVSHAGNPGGTSAPGTLQHVALNVDTPAELLAMRDRIRSRGIPVFGPIDHGFCTSIYFAGPENLNLEISTSGSAQALDPRQWIDPEVVALAGISAAELAAYVQPPAQPMSAGSVPQPAFDAAKPQMTYPPELYQRMLAMPDEEFTRLFSETRPPVAA